MLADTPVKLPVKLDWNDVPGWQGGGWSGAGSNMQAYADCQRNNVNTCWTEVRETWQAENPDKNFCRGRHVQEYKACLDSKCEEEEEEVEECETVCPAIDEGECYDKGEFVQSYKIEITGDLRNCGDGSDMDSHSEVLYISEFFAPCECFYKPNRTYTWRVRACCGPDGETECGPWSKTSFTTSLAPEPFSPYDPDWAGEGGIDNLSYEYSRELEWCTPEDSSYYHPQAGNLFVPLSYRILIYYFDEAEGKYVCHPLLLNKENECIPYYIGPEGIFPPNKFLAGNFITRNSSYAWQISACRDFVGADCTPYSQDWRLSTTTWNVAVIRNSPPNDKEKPIGIPIRLAWGSSFANSFNYRIYEGDVGSCTAGGPIVEDKTGDYEMILYHQTKTEPLSILELDTVYTWCVQPCQDFDAKDCDEWGGPWYFRTTGRPPELDTMKPEGDDLLIPIEFSWEKVPGAKSYWFQLNGKEPILVPEKEAKIEIDYPDLKPESSYSWKVQTCAEPDGQICGDDNSKILTTFSWEELSEPKPEDEEKLPGNTISWERVRGARFYKYEVRFVELDEDETREECEEKIDQITDQGTTGKPSANLSLGLGCWGKYEWSVTPCLDKECQERGDEKSWFFTFKAVFLPSDTKPGLIPCNQPYYDPDRPWLDETESCEIKHLFVIIYIITNFLFVRVLPMILVLLVLASGVIFYFSIKMEAPNPAAKVKALWKAAGIGIGLLLFAWIITSLLLNLFDYQLGPWHILG